jgi:hypothetical protein
MARDYTKIKAWQLAEELGLLVYMKEFQKSEIGLISYMMSQLQRYFFVVRQAHHERKKSMVST